MAAGEYAFFNGGANLADLPVPRLYEIAYFLIHREIVLRLDTQDVMEARAKAERRLGEILRSIDDDTGLPAGLSGFGIGPADGSLGPSPFG